ncbi:MAG: heme-binding domain-containing protein [Opitutae bacterium]|nr:heme-binding domain-containing protein [Opitutae bacterium]
MKTSAKILVGLGALLVVAQAIRPMSNRGTVAGPNHLAKLAPVPAEVEAVLQRACYDCHSNATTYPWYANIQPIGWWLEQHVRDGKRHLNFSEFTTYSLKRATKKLEETAAEVREHEMPLPSYTWMHPEAKLSDAEIKLLADWATNTRRAVGVALSAPGK